MGSFKNLLCFEEICGTDSRSFSMHLLQLELWQRSFKETQNVQKWTKYQNVCEKIKCMFVCLFVWAPSKTSFLVRRFVEQTPCICCSSSRNRDRLKRHRTFKNGQSIKLFVRKGTKYMFVCLCGHLQKPAFFWGDLWNRHSFFLHAFVAARAATEIV